MFGYIRPFVPELRVRENELYGAVYCGLCKSMGRGTRFYSRLSLSYDAVFLAFALASFSGEKFKVRKGRCGLNPFRRKPVAEDCPLLRYCAAVSSILTYYSVLDGIADEKGFRKLGARLLLPAAKRMKKNALKIREFDTGLIEGYLADLKSVEEEKSPELDRASECFGRILAYFFECGAPDNKKRSASAVGMCTGKFIYTADACDDLEKDVKNDSYNPLRYGEGDRSVKLFAAYGAMCVEADRAAGELALEGRDGAEYEIARNIVYLGMVSTAERVTSGDNTGRKHGKHGKRSV